MLNPGDSFGDYKVIRLLGKGGMGAVFLLENAEGVQVAAKILDPATAGDHETRRRFVREAQLALGVKHPNLVETYDIGEDPDTGLCYILMEYVPGGSLADRIKAGSLPINDSIRIVYQIASVLELARGKGIVHRDIKPGNIMFGADGKAKLADLGIARSGLAGTETTTVTQTGMMIGTPAYMAPEQMLDAHHVDTRADIYSLGIVFFEMLTGKRPNHDDTVVQLMAKAVAGEPIPDVRTLRPEVSAAIAELISLMCAMKADERIATPAEVTTAISQIVHGHEVTIVRKRPRAVARKRVSARKHVSLWILVIGMLAVVVGVSAFVLVGVRELRSLSSPEKPAAANVMRPVEEVASVRQTPPKVVEKTVVITNTVVKTIGKPVEQAIENPVEKAEGKPVAEASASNAPVIQEPRGETDRRVRFAEVDGLTWFYTLEDGNAVIWRGDYRLSNETKPAVKPEPEGAVVVPAELDGHQVSAIGNYAFSRCPKMTSIVIPEGVREIRGSAFHFCKELADVVLPQSLESIKEFAFYGCSSLKSVDIGKCPDVPGNAFLFCGALELVSVSADNPSYVLDDGILLDHMRTKLVFHPRNRDVARIPDGVRIIGAGAFMCCQFKKALIPDSVELIGKSAFEHCNNLREIDFGKGLQAVDQLAFLYCGRLKRLVFPDSLKRLGGGFVSNCPSLETIVFRGDAPEFDAGSKQFLGTVPESLVIAVAPGTRGWNGPDSTDLPKMWPLGNFEDSRTIRYFDQADDVLTGREKADAVSVEAPASCARQKEKLEQMLAVIVPALDELMGGTLKVAGRKIVVSDKGRGYSVSKDGSTLTLAASMSGFPKQTTGVGERVAVFLSGLGRKGSAHTESCADAMDWYLSFRLRELLGNRFDGSEKFTGDLSGLGKNALKKDPNMTLYDLRGESLNRKARKLVGSEKSAFAKEKCFWLFEQMRARNAAAVAGFLKAWERERTAGNLSEPVSQDDVAALFSQAVGEDLFDWFSEHAMPSSPSRTKVVVKVTGASTPAGWLDDLEIAKARAKASGKMILAAFEGSDWCGWCKKMEKDVYTHPDFMPRVTPRFLPVYIDSPRDHDLLSEKCREQNPKLHRDYDIHSVPCVVIMDAEGKEIGRVGGYKKNVAALMNRVDALVRRRQDPSVNVRTDGKRRR